MERPLRAGVLLLRRLRCLHKGILCVIGMRTVALVLRLTIILQLRVVGTYGAVVTEKKEFALNPLLILVIIALVISGAGLIVFIMLHSGKGTGISDAIASSLYSTSSGTSIIEKNLDRITIIFAVVFLISLILLMIIYPQGTIA